MKIECVFKTDSIIGEGPIWHPDEKVLYWVDIAGKKIHSYDPRSKHHKNYLLPEIVTSLALRKKGGFVLTLRNQFVFFNPKNLKITPIAQVETNLPENRFNDGKCDRFGRFWAGTMNGVHWKDPSGSLYCLSPSGKLDARLKEAICLNGLGWSPDNRTMYVTESFRYAIFAYDFDGSSRELSNKRVFVSIPEESGGFPDGLTIDSEGYVWSAQTGTGQVIRFHPNGSIDQVIQFPVLRTTSCTFGGDHLDILYVTSARETMSPLEIEKYPLAGSLFSVKTSVKGLPEPFFLG